MVDRTDLLIWPLVPFAIVGVAAALAPHSDFVQYAFVILFVMPGAALWCFVGFVLSMKLARPSRLASGANIVCCALALVPVVMVFSGAQRFHI